MQRSYFWLVQKIMKIYEKEFSKPYKSIYHWKAYKTCVMMLYNENLSKIYLLTSAKFYKSQNSSKKILGSKNFHFEIKHSFQKLLKSTSNFHQIMSWVISFIFFLQNWSSTIIQDSVTKFAKLLNLQISSNFVIVNSYLTEDYVKSL